jgi:hypothetical protein
MSVGIAVLGCDRPALFEKAVISCEMLAYENKPVAIYCDIDVKREGVGVMKNRLLKQMILDGHEWLFLMEDDIEIVDKTVAERYINAAVASNYPHLMFAHHGGRNRLQSGETNHLRFWPNAVGAFCLYSAEAIDRVGFIDETFPRNHLEHVEHSARILNDYGLRSHPYWPDLKDSHFYLKEQPEGLINRSITSTAATFEAAIEHWQQSHPETSLWSPY